MVKKVEIGDATLYLGDCLEILPELKADTVITDPPYNVGYKYGNHNDSMENNAYIEWLQKRFQQASTHVGIKNLLWFWQGIRVANGEVQKVIPHGWRVHHLAGWFRKEFAGDIYPNGHPCYSWEPIIWATREESPNFMATKFGHGARDMQMGNSARHDGVTEHPCPKTLSVVCAITAWVEGDTILDPFMGSGTMGIAAFKNNRKFIGIEIDPEYFEIACERIEKEANQLKLPITP